MTPSERAQLRATAAQVAAVKEQALALSMQADTLERTLRALVDAGHGPMEAERGGLLPEAPAKVRHFNMPQPTPAAP